MLTVPNYRNVQAPMHELEVDPFTARNVKIELVSWETDAGFPKATSATCSSLGELR